MKMQYQKNTVGFSIKVPNRFRRYFFRYMEDSFHGSHNIFAVNEYKDHEVHKIEHADEWRIAKMVKSINSGWKPDF
ncbi:hypothetical protein [Sediminibacter sp. Hel_I_10]|uniref:hypothetical protein n=1 Tax=Sediminibacter sp. Hel_I_10 TaxID=1392490 RepID=UPI00047D4CB5|nr:hypothetical protein [Sediminibacter sp. Hel_I_10]